MDARSVATDIWLMDANQGGLSRFASAPGVDTTPVWSPDDQRMAFSSDRGGIYGALNGFIQAIGTLGKEELVVKNGRIRDWSSDGRYLLYDHRDADGGFDSLYCRRWN